jgi:hypothetical protein
VKQNAGRLRIHPTLESYYSSGSVKEAGGDAQCANLIASSLRNTDFVDLAIHNISSVREHDRR